MDRPTKIIIEVVNKDDYEITCIDEMTGSGSGMQIPKNGYEALREHFKTGVMEISSDDIGNCNIPHANNWVSVTERMPPRPDEDYLVVMRNKNKEGGIALQDIKNFTGDGTWVGGNNWENVVAWAELPEPPCL